MDLSMQIPDKAASIGCSMVNISQITTKNSMGYHTLFYPKTISRVCPEFFHLPYRTESPDKLSKTAYLI